MSYCPVSYSLDRHLDHEAELDAEMDMDPELDSLAAQEPAQEPMTLHEYEAREELWEVLMETEIIPALVTMRKAA